ncbi:MAG TPA: GNAT family N-acetyltransferase [Lentimicrobium sp.]|nr:GNAT family N-acetyltransferase [Lentimicrobium sp.]
MKDFEIIEYHPGLYDKINKFWMHNGLGGSFRGDNREIIDATIQAGGHLIIIIDNNEDIIGTSWITNDKRRSYIHHFGIEVKYRRQGLAKKLMNHTMEIVQSIGFQVKLEVHKDNLPARQLYELYGFKYLGDYDVLIKREV